MPTPITRPIYLLEQNRKVHIPGEPDPDPSTSDSSSKKYNSLKDINYSKSNKNKSIRRKSVVNTRNRTPQTRRQAILILPTTVTTEASDVKRRAIGKRVRSNYPHV